MLLLLVVYLLLAAVCAGWFYSERRKRNYDVDHELDDILSILVGVFFPIAMPFCLAFSYVRHREEKERGKK